ncbi:MAG: DUF4294 domain-containing protein [Prevotellaceae bacterium]|jgi:hypothetical protein|nr:DUF4294 domain-containing protein [Prevotellaceae bacterium]
MYVRRFLTLLLLFVSGSVEAKTVSFLQCDTVVLPGIYVYAWKNKKDFNRFKRTVYNLKKVYPYTQIAKKKLAELDRKYQSIPSKKERKAFAKQTEKELFAEFDAPLRDLTVSQGKMLIKLIDRETGKTSYSVLKEFRGGFSALFWQSIAVVFGHNLKAKYDGDSDKILEELVQMCEHGTFEDLYYSLFPK